MDEKNVKLKLVKSENYRCGKCHYFKNGDVVRCIEQKECTKDEGKGVFYHYVEDTEETKD